MGKDGIPLDLGETDAYKSLHPSILCTRLRSAFEAVLGYPHGAVSSGFFEELEKVLRDNHSSMCRSPLRMALEGGFPGVVNPIREVHAQYRKRIEQAVLLMDVLETLLLRETEKSLAGASREMRSGLTELRKTAGTRKIPRLSKALRVYEEGKKKT